jgi:hypothetical protein
MLPPYLSGPRRWSFQLTAVAVGPFSVKRRMLLPIAPPWDIVGCWTRVTRPHRWHGRPMLRIRGSALGLPLRGR